MGCIRVTSIMAKLFLFSSFIQKASVRLLVTAPGSAVPVPSSAVPLTAVPVASASVLPGPTAAPVPVPKA